MKFKAKLKPGVIITISIIIAAVMIISAYIELQQSKEEIFQLLNEHSTALIETVCRSSENTLQASWEIEDLMISNLLDNAHLIRRIDSLNRITNDKLIQIGKENDLYRINIFDKNGTRIYSNRVPEFDHQHGEENINRFKELEPILTGKSEQMIIGLKDAEFSEGQRFAVAVSRAEKKGAIVVNLNADKFLEFRKKIGIGKIINDIADNHGIRYIVLQDSLGILAASRGVDSLSSFSADPLLKTASYSDTTLSRVVSLGNDEVFEVLKPLVVEANFIGLFRIGISMEDIRKVEDRMVRRIIIISLILAAFSVIVLSILFTQQNLKTVTDEYNRFRSFTSNVLESMSEAVIVTDNRGSITLFNMAAEKLFGLDSNSVIGKNLNTIISEDILTDELRNNMRQNPVVNFEKKFMRGEASGYFDISVSLTPDEAGELSNYTFVISDITEKRKLESRARQTEKLTAMGELASGVAHEIRNPINAIGMIAQRLNREFSPVADNEDYKAITRLLKEEVDRINRIITQFLNYAKPLGINKKKVDADKFFKDLTALFDTQMRAKEITFELSGSAEKPVNIDPELMKQALINILSNAIDATGQKGKIGLSYFIKNDNLIIEVSDNGTGISEEDLKHIFDLYFTRKNDGTGIGLSIAQKIISQHNGTIEAISKPGTGTKFIITLPL